jgi:hypothetical protein
VYDHALPEQKEKKRKEEAITVQEGKTGIIWGR